MPPFVPRAVVLTLCAISFCAGGITVGLLIYWPLISQTLFPGVQS